MGSDEMQRLFDRLPPHDSEAEMALLGSLILAGGGNLHVIGDVMEVVRGPGDFFIPKHQAIYKAITDNYDETASVDTVQLTSRLRKDGLYEAIGGVDYLIELAEAVPTAINGPRFGKIVRDLAVRRDLGQVCAEGLREAYESPEPTAELVDKVEGAMFEISDKGEPDANRATSLSDAIQAQFDMLERMAEGGAPGLMTGYYRLDELLLGFHAGEMITLAARPSMGKTALALNIAENVAISSKQPVGVMSMEMSKDELGLRLLSSRAQVDSSRIRRNMLDDREMQRLREAAEVLSQAPVMIDDTPGLSISRLRAKARRMASRSDIQLLVVDYLQLMNQPGYEKRHEEVSAISRGIKGIARELNIPVLCLSQLNRMSAQRDDKRPRMSELRESGSIEQDSDVVMLLHREAHYHIADPDWARDNPDKANVGEVIIEKQRNGRTGVVELNWLGQYTRFENAAARLPEGVYKTQGTQGWDPSQRD